MSVGRPAGLAGIAVGAALLLVPLVAGLGSVAAGSASLSAAGADDPAATSAAPSAVAGIPTAYLQAFEAAGARFGVPWPVLAGIYRMECDFGESQLAGCRPGTENSAGAQGPGQFLPTTWRRGLSSYQLIPLGPPSTSDADGYATDGDGDGVADVWDPADAAAATARLLAANGGSTDLSGAVFAYNHDASYVQQALSYAGQYSQAAAGVSPGRTEVPRAVLADPDGSAALAAVMAFAGAQMGKPYQWGGIGPSTWDCSGLVQAAFAQAGITLPRVAADQYAATAAWRVPLNALQPGDLIFYGTSAPAIHHVGISLGGDKMIDAPYTGTVVRVDGIEASDLFAATRPLAEG